MLKEKLYFQICQLPLSDCAVKKSLPTIFCVIWILAILWILHPFAYATSKRARLSSQPDIRQPNGKFANHSLQSVFNRIHLNLLLTLFLSQMFIACNFLHRLADALYGPASVRVCVKRICRFACVRSEPAISYVCVCLQSLAPSQRKQASESS